MGDMMIATMWSGRVTADDKKRWRAKLEELGLEAVQAHLTQMSGDDPNEAVPFDQGPPPWITRQTARNWLREKRTSAKRRELWMIIVPSMIAAISSAIAALLAMKDWLMK
jgi:hypothetical protein